jgi:class 3 adenylate cyclase
MAAARADRRLAAIVAIDVVGYSRLVGADETGTLVRVKAHRVELAEPLVAEHHGRVVKLTGDGALVEFGSAVDAVECAVAIQSGVAKREAAEPEERRSRYRIGINIGDIVLEDRDIFGDGVNVAARLEALAEPGGICVSRTVYNHVRNKVGFAFEPTGEICVNRPRAASTPAWSHDPTEAPIDTDIEVLFLNPTEDLEAISLDPAEAPIDTEMKILWLENIEARLRENLGAVRSGLGGQAAARIGPTVVEQQPAPTEREPCRELGRYATFRRSSVLRPRPTSRVRVVAARSMSRTSRRSACRKGVMLAGSSM